MPGGYRHLNLIYDKYDHKSSATSTRRSEFIVHIVVKGRASTRGVERFRVFVILKVFSNRFFEMSVKITLFGDFSQRSSARKL